MEIENKESLKLEAINALKAQMKINAQLYEDGEYSYEELHYVQNECMRKIKDIENS